MSMSTGDVRRPFTAKQTKAVAADDASPEDADQVETEADDDAAEAESTSTRAPAAKKAAAKKAGARASGGAAARGTAATGGSGTRGTAASGGSAARGAAAKASPAKAAPAKSTPSAKSASTAASPASPAKSTSPAAKSTSSGAKTTSRPATATGRPGSRPAVKAGGKGRKPITPVKVHKERNWGPIAMFGGAGLVALLIIGFAAFQLYRQANQPTWQDRAAGIDGINNYIQSNPDWFAYGPEGNHKAGQLTYPSNPPVGGVHNDRWQNCMGDVYTSQIAKEHAVHSLEHGAVWVAYRPDLPQDQIDKLAAKVRDRSFMMMSPYPGLDRPISLQAWGYQLKVDSPDDGRIDDFIGALRQNATQEPQATCSSGITDATPTPIDLPPAGTP
jgi:hypothetical protein